jgi:hypothetical protein
MKDLQGIINDKIYVLGPSESIFIHNSAISRMLYLKLGEVAEWLIAQVSKTCMAAMSSRVRTPPSPPKPFHF